jgi:hypothetical protein
VTCILGMEDEGSGFLKNIGNHMLHYTLAWPGRQYLSLPAVRTLTLTLLQILMLISGIVSVVHCHWKSLCTVTESSLLFLLELIGLSGL